MGGEEGLRRPEDLSQQHDQQLASQFAGQQAPPEPDPPSQQVQNVASQHFTSQLTRKRAPQELGLASQHVPNVASQQFVSEFAGKQASQQLDLPSQQAPKFASQPFTSRLDQKQASQQLDLEPQQAGCGGSTIPEEDVSMDDAGSEAFSQSTIRGDSPASPVPRPQALTSPPTLPPASSPIPSPGPSSNPSFAPRLPGPSRASLPSPPPGNLEKDFLIGCNLSVSSIQFRLACLVVVVNGESLPQKKDYSGLLFRYLTHVAQFRGKIAAAWNHAVTDATPSPYNKEITRLLLLQYSPPAPEAQFRSLCAVCNPQLDVTRLWQEFQAVRGEVRGSGQGASLSIKRTSATMDASAPKRPRLSVPRNTTTSNAEIDEQRTWEVFLSVMDKWDKEFEACDQAVRDVSDAELLHHLSQGALEKGFLGRLEDRLREASVATDDMEL